MTLAPIELNSWDICELGWFEAGLKVEDLGGSFVRNGKIVEDLSCGFLVNQQRKLPEGESSAIESVSFQALSSL